MKKLWRPTLVFVVVGLAVVFVFFGAQRGVPIDQSAHVISSASENELEQAEHSNSTGTVGPHETTFRIFLLRNGRLIAVDRSFTRPADRLDELNDALNLLALGPSEKDGTNQITTALSETPQSNPQLLQYQAKTRVATVELDSTFQNLVGSTFEEALAQIVYTLTGSGVSGVLFVENGAQIDAITPTGQLVSTAVNRHDYASIGPTGPGG